MDDRDFFDTLYQGWSKTTGAENRFWMPEEGGVFDPGFHIWAVDSEQQKEYIGSVQSEDDAAWITAMHGCFADLTRRLHEAVDEAERLSVERDDAQAEIADLALENMGLREEIRSLEEELDR